MKRMTVNPATQPRPLPQNDSAQLTRRRRALALIVLGGLLLGASAEHLPPIDVTGWIGSVVPERTEPVLPPVLGDEWKPLQPVVTFDHMFMDAPGRRNLDWIRDGGRR